MKDKFKEHFRPSEEEFNELWDNPLFVLDANILLNLYRYSEETRDQLILLLSRIQESLWIPYQAAYEYFVNRLNVTNGQAKEYEKLEEELKNIENKLSNKKRHPFVSSETHQKLIDFLKELKNELEENKNKLLKRLNHDELLEKIANFTDKKVGDKYPQDQLSKIYEEGEQRYELNIPPGWKDGKKDKGGDLYKKYGDLVLWYQIIDKAKESEKNIIFITDDKKEDWWLEISGKKIGPLPQLIKEFNDKASQEIYMYTADKFMIEAKKKFGEEAVTDEAISEVEEIRKLLDKIKESRESVRDSSVNFKYNNHDIISEEEMVEEIKNYEKEYCYSDNSFVGLKNFVTNYLAEKNFEINHSYAIANSLDEKGVIKIYEINMGDYPVKAIKLNDE
jgi:hypothetical protein